MKQVTARKVTYLVAAVGIFMYAAALIERIDRLHPYTFWVVVFNILPYLVCLVLVRTVQRPLAPLCASILLLIADTWLFKDIIAFKGFSVDTFVYSAVITMYAPLWKMALVLPAGCIVGLVIDRRLH